MKKIMILLSLSLLLFSCEKEQQEPLVPSGEVPAWLKIRIAEDEKEIAANPRSGLDIAAWIRYEFSDKYFFEYHNLLRSAGPLIYDYDGAVINVLEDPYRDYMTNKCCKQFVWKGPYYIGDD